MAKKGKQLSKAPELSLEALAERLGKSGFVLEEKPLKALFEYLELLQKWNAVMNLVGPYPWPDMVDNLILDSFHLAAFLESLPLTEAPECWDFGAGAGLPGVPLRILWQQGRYTMVDSREKRVAFLQNVLARLTLPNTFAQAARVEDFMDGAPPASLLLSRAFMPWQKLLPLVQKKLTPSGPHPAIAVFMTLEPAPSDLPGPWRVLAQTSYEIPAGKRYFWALSPSSEG